MNFKLIFAFAAGLTTGIAGTYVYCKKKLEAQYEADIAESKAYYADKLTELDEIASNALNGAKNGLKQADFEGVKEISESNGYSKPENDETEQPKEKVEYDRDAIIESMNYASMYISKERKEEPVVIKSPEIISDSEYYSDEEYGKEIYTYYSESGDFVDEDDHLVRKEEILGKIGNPDYLHEFGGFESDVLFIRNYDYMTDMQIILEESEYESEE